MQRVEGMKFVRKSLQNLPVYTCDTCGGPMNANPAA
jgi:hypothetical protein